MQKGLRYYIISSMLKRLVFLVLLILMLYTHYSNMFTLQNDLSTMKIKIKICLQALQWQDRMQLYQQMRLKPKAGTTFHSSYELVILLRRLKKRKKQRFRPLKCRRPSKFRDCTTILQKLQFCTHEKGNLDFYFPRIERNIFPIQNYIRLIVNFSVGINEVILGNLHIGL